MQRSKFEDAIYAKWAERYDCTTEDLRTPGTEVLPDEDFANSAAVHIWTIGKRAFARMDPACEDVVREALCAHPAGTSLLSDHLAPEITGRAIRRTEDNQLHYLYPADLCPVVAAPPLAVRELTRADKAALTALQSACDRDETEEAEVSVEDEIGFGCFDGPTMVAIATGFHLTGFMDIGVLTHPNYRRRRLGKACVTALSRWCIDHDIIAQYRCRANNIGSRSIAEALGFRLFFTERSVYFASPQKA